MVELPLIVLGGFLGSSHCVGMCGGFALSIGMGARGFTDNLSRQLIFCFGRVFTYGFFGAAAGFAGFWFTQRSGTFIHLQAALSMLAGAILVIQGLNALGVFPRSLSAKFRVGPGALCSAGKLYRPFLTSRRRLDVLIAGMLNGLLPCGLLYGYLSLASSTASLAAGLATMVAFGLGTMPLMVLSGVGASALSLVARRRVFRVAAVCVVATGLLAVARGVVFWSTPETSQCPACSSSNRTA